MNAMVQKTSDTGFSAPLFVQEMAGYCSTSISSRSFAR